MEVRPPRDDAERSAARAVVDTAMLEVPDDAEWLVAVDGGDVIGSLALDGEEIVAIAVRRGRRGEGVGRALVAGAAERRGRLVAEFREGVRPFYEALGFEVAATDDDRYRAVLVGDLD